MPSAVMVLYLPRRFAVYSPTAQGLPRIHIALCTAGSTPPQSTSAVHIVVATMGRLNDTLRRGQMSLAACEVLAIDEAERVLDQDFKEDMKTLIPHFRVRRA